MKISRLLISSLVLFLPSLSAHARSAVPRYISYRIGSVDIRSVASERVTAETENQFIIDPKTKYCLYTNHQGPAVQIELMSHEALMDNSDENRAGYFYGLAIKGNSKSVHRRPIVPLGTDLGVRIGSSPKAVLGALGLPTSHDDSLDGDPERTGSGTYRYYYPGGQLDGWSYEAWYEFKHGKLEMISISMQKGNEVAG